MMFSIIVPIFNVDKYINRCLESITSQSFSDYEIILIDDSSNDRSLEIAYEWKRKNNNISVIAKKENTGLSDTRNTGLKVAKGDYVLFVDSDDYVACESLTVFNGIICKFSPDVIYAGFIKEYENGKSIPMYGFLSKTEQLYTAEEYMYSELMQRNLFAAAAFGIYRRELLQSKELYFKKGILHEDEHWTPRVLMNCETIYLSGLYFYHYLKREGSITTRKDRTQNGIDLITTCIELEGYAKQHIKNKKILKLYHNQLAKLYMKATCVGKLYRDEYKDMIDRLFPIKHASIPFDIVKAFLFAISLKLYSRFDQIYGDDWRS